MAKAIPRSRRGARVHAREHAAMFERMTVAYSDAWLTAMVEQMRRQADA